FSAKVNGFRSNRDSHDLPQRVEGCGADDSPRRASRGRRPPHGESSLRSRRSSLVFAARRVARIIVSALRSVFIRVYLWRYLWRLSVAFIRGPSSPRVSVSSAPLW